MINIILIILLNLFIVNQSYCTGEVQLSVGKQFELTNIISMHDIDEYDPYSKYLSNEYKKVETWAGTQYVNVTFYVSGIPIDEYNKINNYSTNNSPDMILKIIKDATYEQKGRFGGKREGYICEFIGWSGKSNKILETIKSNEENEKAKIAGLKEGKVKVTTIQEAIIALSPSQDDSYTYGLPLDGNITGANKYFLWRAKLISLNNDIYTCANLLFDGRLKAFAFTKIKGKNTELLENKEITVIGKFTNVGEISLKSGNKRKIPILTESYVFD